MTSKLKWLASLAELGAAAGIVNEAIEITMEDAEGVITRCALP